MIVTVAGISPSDAGPKKTEGVRTGLAMPAPGLFFLVRMRPRPAEAPAAPEPAPSPESDAG
ncbi:hypothetical protein EES46_27190 [Streptomyces sp. ADI98-10]|nr:hypothetical protein EES46_27190 [Streptomyces sp. ADI98-10]